MQRPKGALGQMPGGQGRWDIAGRLGPAVARKISGIGRGVAMTSRRVCKFDQKASGGHFMPIGPQGSGKWPTQRSRPEQFGVRIF